MFKDSVIFAIEAYFLTFVIAIIIAAVIKLILVFSGGKRKVPAAAEAAVAQPTKKEE